MHPLKFCFLLVMSLFSWGTLCAQDQEYQSIPLEDTISTKSKKVKSSSKEVSDDEKKWDWKNFRVGGNLGLSFGRQTYVEVSPSFGYWVMPSKLQVGISTKFIYQSYKDYYNQKWQSFIYGGGVFADYVIWRGLFARGEFELINKESGFNDYRVNVPHLMLGGGYVQEVGDYGNFYIAVLYDILNTDESIYNGTFGDFPLILRMGFGFGFPGNRR